MWSAGSRRSARSCRSKTDFGMERVDFMEELMLMLPDEAMLDEITSYRSAMLNAGSSMDGCSGLQKYENAQDCLTHVRSMMKLETCPPQWVTSTLFVCVRKADGRIVGMVDLRHRLNELLATWGGHIGYSVRPDERRRGYVKWMLAHVLPEAKKLGIDRVLVTCNDENVGSARTIEANGGVLENKVYVESEKQTIRRYWIDL